MSIAITTTPFKDAHEIHDLEKQLRQHISEQSKKIDTALYKKIIDTVTKGPLRRPDLVTLCGQELLFGDVSSSFKKSVDAIYLWQLYEIVLKSALELNQQDLADSCLEAIQNKFGESPRIRKLEALVLEAKGDLEESEQIYNELLRDDPTDVFVLKRLVAIKIATNDIPEAIKRLNHYLSIYMSDMDAYSEMADLYLRLCDYKKAAFCVEEMIVHDPNHPMYFCKYADIMYTMDDYRTARKYYAQCIQMMMDVSSSDDLLSSENQLLSSMRPVYGLLMSCNALAALDRFESSGAFTKKMNQELLKLAETLLVKNYTKISNEATKKNLLPVLETFLKL